MIRVRVWLTFVLLFFRVHIIAAEITPSTDAIQLKKAGTEVQKMRSGLVHDMTAARERFARAQQLESSGDGDGAINMYREIIAAYPSLPEPYNNLAILLAEKGELSEAKAILEKGLTTSESYAAVYENLRTINLELARDSYIKALRLGVKPEKLALKKLAELSIPISGHKTVVLEAPRVAARAANELKTDDPRSVLQAEIEVTLQGWAAAWSAQNPDLYLSFYSEYFSPPRGLTRNIWAKQRRQRLQRPNWIKVQLEDIAIGVAGNKQVVVNLKQKYEADQYRDVTVKRMTLLREEDGWRIAKETSLGTASR